MIRSQAGRWCEWLPLHQCLVDWEHWAILVQAVWLLACLVAKAWPLLSSTLPDSTLETALQKEMWMLGKIWKGT